MRQRWKKCLAEVLRSVDGQRAGFPVGQAGEYLYVLDRKCTGNRIFKFSSCREISKDGFRSVGDIGYIDNDGYLYFVDRRSDMIVTGGENVFANEVETVLKNQKKF